MSQSSSVRSLNEDISLLQACFIAFNSFVDQEYNVVSVSLNSRSEQEYIVSVEFE